MALLLEHGSATEERLAEGTGAALHETDGDKTYQSKSKVLQELELSFCFHPSLPKIRVREIALDWNQDAFQTKAADDTTGVTVWSASIILSRWIMDLSRTFDNKTVCELGSGCGLSGIAAYLFTQAKRVVLTDLFDNTLENLRYNAELNKNEDCCEHCTKRPCNGLLICSGCGSAQYCTRKCQKLAWKAHKPYCTKEIMKRTLLVQALDWETPPVLPKFDIIIGSDLVYHADIVHILANTINQLLEVGGKFYHVASDQRSSLEAFSAAMSELGFSCVVTGVPDHYKVNPLEGRSMELFDIHFNEMDDTYMRYTFTKNK